MMIHPRFSRFIVLTALFLALPSGVMADTAKTAPPVDIIPAHSATADHAEFKDSEATHPALRLTPDKSELITLERPAKSIIIGNPDHANVMADSAKTLVVVPRAPGATFFTVLDEDGEVIMARHILVAAPTEDYVRVRRTCAGDSGDDCEKTRVFYCPDTCHDIGSSAGGTAAGGDSAADTAAAATQSMSDTVDDAQSE